MKLSKNVENRIDVPCPCGMNDLLIGIYLPIWEGIGKMTCPVCKETYYIKVNPEQICFISEEQYEEEEKNGTWYTHDEEEEVFPVVDKEEKCICEEEDRMSGLWTQING